MKGHLRVRDVARPFAVLRALRARRVSSAFELVRSFSELELFEEGEAKPAHAKELLEEAAAQLILAICLWCGARGCDPQDAFEQAWKDFIKRHGDEL